MISIAIPDSLFSDEGSLRDKTIKAGSIARATSVFGVERIYIFRDSSRNYDQDYDVARSILEYAETPQYLRKRLIGKKADLEFVGFLPPLRTPHHLMTSNIKNGEIREAVLLFQNNQLKAEIGAKELAKFDGTGQTGQRLTAQVTSLNPLSVVPVGRPANSYWGYEIRRAPNLARFLRGANFDLVVLTSRWGKGINEEWTRLAERVRSAKKCLVCFGSPEKGLIEILRRENAKVDEFRNSVLINMFPSQNVETVRLEEAILGSLVLLNLARYL